MPVGYSNKAGMIFNLLRGDLGHSGDPNSMNYEVAYGRGRWPGEYTVNAHFYRSADGRYPVAVTAKVAMRHPFERSWDKREAMFYPEPQPMLPDEGGAPPPAPIYQAPEQGA